MCAVYIDSIPMAQVHYIVCTQKVRPMLTILYIFLQIFCILVVILAAAVVVVVCLCHVVSVMQDTVTKGHRSFGAHSTLHTHNTYHHRHQPQQNVYMHTMHYLSTSFAMALHGIYDALVIISAYALVGKWDFIWDFFLLLFFFRLHLFREFSQNITDFVCFSLCFATFVYCLFGILFALYFSENSSSFQPSPIQKKRTAKCAK